jgi:hypothetical protein
MFISECQLFLSMSLAFPQQQGHLEPLPPSQESRWNATVDWCLRHWRWAVGFLAVAGSVVANDQYQERRFRELHAGNFDVQSAREYDDVLLLFKAMDVCQRRDKNGHLTADLASLDFAKKSAASQGLHRQFAVLASLTLERCKKPDEFSKHFAHGYQGIVSPRVQPGEAAYPDSNAATDFALSALRRCQEELSNSVDHPELHERWEAMVINVLSNVNHAWKQGWIGENQLQRIGDALDDLKVEGRFVAEFEIELAHIRGALHDRCVSSK